MSNTKNQETINKVENIRKDNLKRLDNAAFHWNTLANKQLSEFSKNLVSITTVVIPLILVILGLENTGQFLSSFEKLLLSISLVLFLFSLAFGLKHIFREAKFFNKWGEVESERSKIFTIPLVFVDAKTAVSRLQEMRENSEKLRQILNLRSNSIDLYAQIALLSLGMIIITFITLNVITQL